MSEDSRHVDINQSGSLKWSFSSDFSERINSLHLFEEMRHLS